MKPYERDPELLDNLKTIFGNHVTDAVMFDSQEPAPNAANPDDLPTHGSLYMKIGGRWICLWTSEWGGIGLVAIEDLEQFDK